MLARRASSAWSRRYGRPTLLKHRPALARVSSPEKKVRTSYSLDQAQMTSADVPKNMCEIMSKLVTDFVRISQPNPPIGVVMTINWLNTHSYNLPR